MHPEVATSTRKAKTKRKNPFQIKVKVRREKRPKLDKSFPRKLAEKAVEAVKVDGISIEDLSVKFNIPSQIIQELLDDKVQVGTSRGP